MSENRVASLRDFLEELIPPEDEDIIYEAVDQLRHRWRQLEAAQARGFGLARLKAEGGAVPYDPATLPTYRELIEAHYRRSLWHRLRARLLAFRRYDH